MFGFIHADVISETQLWLDHEKVHKNPDDQNSPLIDHPEDGNLAEFVQFQAETGENCVPRIGKDLKLKSFKVDSFN